MAFGIVLFIDVSYLDDFESYAPKLNDISMFQVVAGPFVLGEGKPHLVNGQLNEVRFNSILVVNPVVILAIQYDAQQVFTIRILVHFVQRFYWVKTDFVLSIVSFNDVCQVTQQNLHELLPR